MAFSLPSKRKKKHTNTNTFIKIVRRNIIKKHMNNN